jgi:hypothetical protein
MQEAPVRRLNIRDRYLCKNPDFLSSWPLIFQAACKCPDWWPARKTAIVEERMFSEHTKVPGRPPDRDRPFTLRRGQTVEDVARLVHKDLARSLKYARVWGKSGFDGQHVGRDHLLTDGDVVELQT